MIDLTNKTRDANSINHEALVLGITYTLTPGEKLARLTNSIDRYEQQYGHFDIQSNLEVSRILSCNFN